MRYRSLLLMFSLLLPFAIHAQDDRLTVVASFSILADTVQRVAGDGVSVQSLIPFNADPHTFEPTPREIAALADADAVFISGIGFESNLLEIIENADAGMNIIRVSDCVTVLPIGAHHDGHEADDAHESESLSAESDPRCDGQIQEVAALHNDAHTDEADADQHPHTEALGRAYMLDCDAHDHAAEAEGEHDHGACDPHVWGNPHNVIYWTMNIRDTLITLDPTNTDQYTANAAAYIAELDALTDDFVIPALASIPEANRKLVTSHDTLGYLAALGGLDIIGVVIAGGSTTVEPSAQDIAALIGSIQEQNALALFVETTTSPTLAEQVAAEAGIPVLTLYSDTLSDGEPAATYIAYMRYNVTQIVTALGGQVPTDVGM
ncbi:MAG: metal ABC transporter substrate-binding protein [Phototrophicaceae bacterium]